jgi:hypothetical protein
LAKPSRAAFLGQTAAGARVFLDRARKAYGLIPALAKNCATASIDWPGSASAT